MVEWLVMNFFKDYKNKLYCFTPEVMMMTFVTEIILGVYAFIRYRTTVFGRIGILVLFSLAVFQLAEYQVCTGGDEELWLRIGFVGVTLLPVLGFHLVALLTKRKKALGFVYALAFTLLIIFAALPSTITGAVCSDNYIVFHAPKLLSLVYTLFYFGTLILGIWNIVQTLKRKASAQYTGKERALAWILAGYLSFLIPMAVVYIYSPAARHAVPSVMCGFAVIFAIILTFKVLPNYMEKKE